SDHRPAGHRPRRYRRGRRRGQAADPIASGAPMTVYADASAPLFFNLSSFALTVLLTACVVGTTVAGIFIGRSMRHHHETLREPYGVLQAALLGFMALIMAFGLSLAVGRYEGRRAAGVDEANA